MLGYVLDGNVARAIGNVGKIVRTRHLALGMTSPGDMLPSSIRPTDSRIKETLHVRANGSMPIQVHHIFVSGGTVEAKVRNKPGKKVA
jgi:hypothetical protein